MAVGTVNWFRGSFGFITPDSHGPDIFVHWRGLLGPKNEHKTLNAGDRVEYDTDISIENNKPIAINVRKLEASHGSSRAKSR